METKINAAQNPGLANELAQKAMSMPEEVSQPATKPVVATPPSGLVTLCAGLLNPLTGELITTAEVRELNGADEEAVSKAPDIGRGLLTILNRATLMIGDERADQKLMDTLLAADRELLLLQIRKMTFGEEIEVRGVCPECNESDCSFKIDLNKDVTIKTLEDPINDRSFTIKCKVGEVSVILPTGSTQKKLIQHLDKTQAELDTLLLRDCVTSINGLPVFSNDQILNLGLKDRREILKQIGDRNPGPQLDSSKSKCSSCQEEVTIPLSLAELFR